MKKLSVIIVTFGAPDMVRDCIESIYKFNDLGDGLEIIVSDNSLDFSVKDMIVSTFKDVIFIKNENVGFGKGNNIGVDASTGQYVLFLNPDTLLIKNIFSDAIAQFCNNPKLGMFGVSLHNGSEKKIVSYFYRAECVGRLLFISNIFIKIANKLGYFNPKKMFPCGAALFVSKKAFEAAGMFDENIFMYFEEPDLQLRMNKVGYLVSYVKEISIVHLCGRSSINKKKQEEIRLESLLYYAKKHNIKRKSICRYLYGEKKLLSIKRLIYKVPNITDYLDMYDRILMKVSEEFQQ